MIILTLRTDKPEAEIGLYDDGRQLAYLAWQAHRQLAETIHAEINKLLKTQSLALSDLEGIAVFKGPGSFTGLRIGLATANALADGLAVPVVGGSGPTWRQQAVESLASGSNQEQILPEYGAAPNITPPKK